jgi:hypothetical protein
VLATACACFYRECANRELERMNREQGGYRVPVRNHNAEPFIKGEPEPFIKNEQRYYAAQSASPSQTPRDCRDHYRKEDDYVGELEIHRHAARP